MGNAIKIIAAIAVIVLVITLGGWAAWNAAWRYATSTETRGPFKRLLRRAYVKISQQFKADTAPPVIRVWYGDRQVFGRLGHPQKWINILGNVADGDSQKVRLTYSLNGEPELHPLPIGPNRRRLWAAGDFNVELDRATLQEGINTVKLVATDGAGNQTSRTVTVEYREGNRWPLPYTIDWQAVGNLQDVVQVVDGHWVLEDKGLRTPPEQVGYDRIVAFGDDSWESYEIVLPLVVHRIDESAFPTGTSVVTAFGVIARWTGHTNIPPIRSKGINCGWIPQTSLWFQWLFGRGSSLHIIEMPGPLEKNNFETSQPRTVELGKTYWLKGRLESLTDITRYSLKLWEDGTPEPDSWDLQLNGTSSETWKGSVLLVAHHVDMTFGNVSVVPIQPLGEADREAQISRASLK